jgi:hypothetical protein
MDRSTNQALAPGLLRALLVLALLPLGAADARQQAMTTYDDDNPAIVYSQGHNGDGQNGWGSGSDPNDFGGGEHYTNAYSGSFVVHFIGTDFQWIGKMGPNFGIASVFMDGQSVGTVDTYNPTVLSQQVLYSTSGLDNVAHCFQMKIGDYPSPATNPSSSGWYQVMDGFATSGTPLDLSMLSPQDNSVTKMGTWSFGPNILSGAYCWSNDRSTPGSLTLPFSGTGVEVYGHPEGEDGMMDVYIDGSYVTTVDLFNPLYDSIMSDSNDDSLVYVATGLPDGNHTLQVVVAQGHNPNSLDYYTQIDGFIVLPGNPAPPPPPPGNGMGLTAEYFGAMDLSNPLLIRTDPTIDFNWSGTSPDPSVPPFQYSVRWTGQVLPLYSETYTFIFTADDGVRVWVNGQALIDAWFDQPATAWSGSIDLIAGQAADIRVEYYQNQGDAVARLEWQSASQSRQVVPQSQLFPAFSDPTGQKLASLPNSGGGGGSCGLTGLESVLLLGLLALGRRR